MTKMPRLIVFSSLFPNAAQPTAGLFIRERMFRVARHLPLVVVSPKPWFPGQGLIRLFRPHYRPLPARREIQDGIVVLFPRFLALPGLLRGLDSLSMAWASYFTLRRLKAQGYNLVDAHFAYPDGHAATRLGRWLNLPVTVTLRGTEVPQSRNPAMVPKLKEVFRQADKVITVSDSLRRLALSLGLAAEKTQVVGNGVDADKFSPRPRAEARARYNLPESAKVLITVGGLVERKGFHRVIACLPELMKNHPDLHYLVVGGPCPEGDMSQALKEQAASLGLGERVHFLGPIPPDDLKWPLSAADVFVLSTRNEGWANVILEAMACGLPVIASDVGGNAEVVCRPELGEIVPFDDQTALTRALNNALEQTWNAEAILAYARNNHWDKRVGELTALFRSIAQATVSSATTPMSAQKAPPSPGNDRRSFRERLEKRLWRAWKVLRHKLATRRPRQHVFVFVAGMQRSGTNLLMDILEWSAYTDVYHETDTRAFDRYELRPRPVIHALAERSHAPFFVIKSLCELDQIAELMHEFRPARTVWIVRTYDDTVSSATRSFGHFAHQLHRLAQDKNSRGWRGRGMSDETQAILRRFDHPELNEASAAALMWYYRNILFFERGLDKNPSVKVLFYEDLVLAPESSLKDILDFLGIPGWLSWLTRHIHTSSARKSPRTDIDPAVRELCDGLAARFKRLKSPIPGKDAI